MFPSWRSLLSWKPILMGNLRRIADNIQPTETIDLTQDDGKELEGPKEDELDPMYKCPICIWIVKNPVATNCGHIFCAECLNNNMQRRKACPLCTRDINSTVRLYV